MAKGKGHAVDWENVQDDNTYPRGWYLVKCKAAELGQLAKKLVGQMEFEVRKPKAFAGSPLYGTLWLGTDEDLDALDPKTQKRSSGFILLKKMAAAAGVKLKGDLEDILGKITGEELMLRVVKGKPNDEGDVRNRIVKAEAPGARTPEIDDEDEGDGAGASKKEAKGKAKPAADEDEDEDEEDEKPAKGKASKKSSDDDEDDEDEEEDEPAPKKGKKATVKDEDEEEEEEESDDEDEDEDEDDKPAKKGKKGKK